MAWRSSGSNNDEMVNNLKRFGIVSSPAVERAFRSVDRKHFVPQIDLRAAHTDQPLKAGNLHISAPHIYGSVLESLELGEGRKSITVLNVGSGTGYLSSLVASISGPGSVHYGVEIYPEVIQHCRESIDRWKREDPHNANASTKQMHFLRGNALHIDPTKGESRLGFDRIYIGASISKSNVVALKRLLKPGGILIGPVGDELLKIRKHQCASMESMGDESFSSELLAGVRFSGLVDPLSDSEAIVLPSRIWNPSVHHQYPQSFKRSCKALLLCSRAGLDQPAPPVVVAPVAKPNVAAMIPSAIWSEILSFTHKDWFEAPQSEVEYLRHRLEEERAETRRANQARLEAEARCRTAERERNVYRLLARRWQTRLLGGEQEMITASEVDASSARTLFGLFRQLQPDADEARAGTAATAAADLSVVVNDLAAVLGVGRRSGDDDDDDDESDDDDDAMESEDEAIEAPVANMSVMAT